MTLRVIKTTTYFNKIYDIFFTILTWGGSVDIDSGSVVIKFVSTRLIVGLCHRAIFNFNLSNVLNSKYY